MATAAEPGLELICRMEEGVKTRRHRSSMICGGSPDKPINENLRGAMMQLFVGLRQWLWRERETVAVEGEKGSPEDDCKGVTGEKI